MNFWEHGTPVQGAGRKEKQLMGLNTSPKRHVEKIRVNQHRLRQQMNVKGYVHYLADVSQEQRPSAAGV